MYDIIIDPDRDGCHVYANGNIARMKGNPNEICSELGRRVTVVEDGKRVQIKSIGIDYRGIGMAYVDYLKRLGIKANKMNYKSLGEILPIMDCCELSPIWEMLLHD